MKKDNFFLKAKTARLAHFVRARMARPFYLFSYMGWLNLFFFLNELDDTSFVLPNKRG
jgi:hypothetical protein